MSIESVMPSSHLILCHPFLLPSVFPSIRVFSSESFLRIRWPEFWSFSFGICPSREYSGLISFRMHWLDLLSAQGLGNRKRECLGVCALSWLHLHNWEELLSIPFAPRAEGFRSLCWFISPKKSPERGGTSGAKGKRVLFLAFVFHSHRKFYRQVLPNSEARSSLYSYTDCSRKVEKEGKSTSIFYETSLILILKKILKP